MNDDILCECGVLFKPKKHKTNKFCSLACYRAAQRRGEYKRGHGENFPSAPCAHCGKTVFRIPSECRDGSASDKVFCNRDCYHAFRSNAINDRAKECEKCGIKFIPVAKTTKFCSSKCWGESKKAKPKNCVNCGCEFTPVKYMASRGEFVSHNGGKTCSAECENLWIRNNPERKKRIAAAFAGANHPNWQGGKSLLNSISNRGPNWPKQRAAAIARDGDKCVDCGITGDDCKVRYGRGLDVDHVVPFHNFNSYKKANVLSNLECRCASCHKIAESKRSMVQMVLPMQDSERRQHKGHKKGSVHPKAKLLDFQVIEIRRKAAGGEKIADLSKEYRVGITNIYAIVSRKIWRHM